METRGQLKDVSMIKTRGRPRKKGLSVTSPDGCNPSQILSNSVNSDKVNRSPLAKLKSTGTDKIKFTRSLSDTYSPAHNSSPRSDKIHATRSQSPASDKLRSMRNNSPGSDHGNVSKSGKLALKRSQTDPIAGVKQTHPQSPVTYDKVKLLPGSCDKSPSSKSLWPTFTSRRSLRLPNTHTDQVHTSVDVARKSTDPVSSEEPIDTQGSMPSQTRCITRKTNGDTETSSNFCSTENNKGDLSSVKLRKKATISSSELNNLFLDDNTAIVPESPSRGSNGKRRSRRSNVRTGTPDRAEPQSATGPAPTPAQPQSVLSNTPPELSPVVRLKKLCQQTINEHSNASSDLENPGPEPISSSIQSMDQLIVLDSDVESSIGQVGVASSADNRSDNELCIDSGTDMVSDIYPVKPIRENISELEKILKKVEKPDSKTMSDVLQSDVNESEVISDNAVSGEICGSSNVLEMTSVNNNSKSQKTIENMDDHTESPSDKLIDNNQLESEATHCDTVTTSCDVLESRKVKGSPRKRSVSTHSSDLTSLIAKVSGRVKTGEENPLGFEVDEADGIDSYTSDNSYSSEDSYDDLDLNSDSCESSDSYDDEIETVPPSDDVQCMDIAMEQTDPPTSTVFNVSSHSVLTPAKQTSLDGAQSNETEDTTGSMETGDDSVREYIREYKKALTASLQEETATEVINLDTDDDDAADGDSLNDKDSCTQLAESHTEPAEAVHIAPADELLQFKKPSTEVSRQPMLNGESQIDANGERDRNIFSDLDLLITEATPVLDKPTVEPLSDSCKQLADANTEPPDAVEASDLAMEDKVRELLQLRRRHSTGKSAASNLPIVSENPKIDDDFKIFKTFEKEGDHDQAHSAFESNALDACLEEMKEMREKTETMAWCGSEYDIDDIDGALFRSFDCKESLDDYISEIEEKSDGNSLKIPSSPSKRSFIGGLTSLKQKQFKYGISGNVSKYFKKRGAIKPGVKVVGENSEKNEDSEEILEQSSSSNKNTIVTSPTKSPSKTNDVTMIKGWRSKFLSTTETEGPSSAPELADEEMDTLTNNALSSPAEVANEHCSVSEMTKELESTASSVNENVPLRILLTQNVKDLDLHLRTQRGGIRKRWQPSQASVKGHHQANIVLKKKNVASFEEDDNQPSKGWIYGRRIDGKFATKTAVIKVKRTGCEPVKRPQTDPNVKNEDKPRLSYYRRPRLTFRTVLMTKKMAVNALSALDPSFTKPSTPIENISEDCDRPGCRYGCVCRKQDLPSLPHLDDYVPPLEDLNLLQSPPLPKMRGEMPVCGHVYCRLGAVCDSLGQCESKEVVEKGHCGNADCMFGCHCQQKPEQLGRVLRSSLWQGDRSESNSRAASPVTLEQYLAKKLMAKSQNSPQTDADLGPKLELDMEIRQDHEQGGKKNKPVPQPTRRCSRLKGHRSLAHLEKNKHLFYYDASLWSADKEQDLPKSGKRFLKSMKKNPSAYQELPDVAKSVTAKGTKTKKKPTVAHMSGIKPDIDYDMESMELVEHIQLQQEEAEDVSLDAELKHKFRTDFDLDLYDKEETFSCARATVYVPSRLLRNKVHAANNIDLQEKPDVKPDTDTLSSACYEPDDHSTRLPEIASVCSLNPDVTIKEEPSDDSGYLPQRQTHNEERQRQETDVQQQAAAKPEPLPPPPPPLPQKKTNVQMVMLQKKSKGKDKTLVLLEIKADCDWSSVRAALLSKVSSALSKGAGKIYKDIEVGDFIVHYADNQSKVPVPIPMHMRNPLVQPVITEMIPIKYTITKKLVEQTTIVPDPPELVHVIELPSKAAPISKLPAILRSDRRLHRPVNPQPPPPVNISFKNNNVAPVKTTHKKVTPPAVAQLPVSQPVVKEPINQPSSSMSSFNHFKISTESLMKSGSGSLVPVSNAMETISVQKPLTTQVKPLHKLGDGVHEMTIQGTKAPHPTQPTGLYVNSNTSKAAVTIARSLTSTSVAVPVMLTNIGGKAISPQATPATKTEHSHGSNVARKSVTKAAWQIAMQIAAQEKLDNEVANLIGKKSVAIKSTTKSAAELAISEAKRKMFVDPVIPSKRARMDRESPLTSDSDSRPSSGSPALVCMSDIPPEAITLSDSPVMDSPAKVLIPVSFLSDVPTTTSQVPTPRVASSVTKVSQSADDEEKYVPAYKQFEERLKKAHANNSQTSVPENTSKKVSYGSDGIWRLSPASENKTTDAPPTVIENISKMVSCGNDGIWRVAPGISENKSISLSINTSAVKAVDKTSESVLKQRESRSVSDSSNAEMPSLIPEKQVEDQGRKSLSPAISPPVLEVIRSSPTTNTSPVTPAASKAGLVSKPVVPIRIPLMLLTRPGKTGSPQILAIPTMLSANRLRLPGGTQSVLKSSSSIRPVSLSGSTASQLSMTSQGEMLPLSPAVPGSKGLVMLPINAAGQISLQNPTPISLNYNVTTTSGSHLQFGSISSHTATGSRDVTTTMSTGSVLSTQHSHTSAPQVIEIPDSPEESDNKILQTESIPDPSKVAQSTVSVSNNDKPDVGVSQETGEFGDKQLLRFWNGKSYVPVEVIKCKSMQDSEAGKNAASKVPGPSENPDSVLLSDDSNQESSEPAGTVAESKSLQENQEPPFDPDSLLNPIVTSQSEETSNKSEGRSDPDSLLNQAGERTTEMDSGTCALSLKITYPKPVFVLETRSSEKSNIVEIQPETYPSHSEISEISPTVNGEPELCSTIPEQPGTSLPILEHETSQTVTEQTKASTVVIDQFEDSSSIPESEALQEGTESSLTVNGGSVNASSDLEHREAVPTFQEHNVVTIAEHDYDLPQGSQKINSDLSNEPAHVDEAYIGHTGAESSQSMAVKNVDNIDHSLLTISPEPTSMEAETCGVAVSEETAENISDTTQISQPMPQRTKLSPVVIKIEDDSEPEDEVPQPQALTEMMHQELNRSIVHQTREPTSIPASECGSISSIAEVSEFSSQASIGEQAENYSQDSYEGDDDLNNLDSDDVDILGEDSEDEYEDYTDALRLRSQVNSSQTAAKNFAAFGFQRPEKKKRKQLYNDREYNNLPDFDDIQFEEKAPSLVDPNRPTTPELEQDSEGEKSTYKCRRERRRRHDMTYKFEVLQTMLYPSSERMAKQFVLDAAVKTIENLKTEKRNLDVLHAQYTKKRDQLVVKLRSLKERPRNKYAAITVDEETGVAHRIIADTPEDLYPSNNSPIKKRKLDYSSYAPSRAELEAEVNKRYKPEWCNRPPRHVDVNAYVKKLNLPPPPPPPRPKTASELLFAKMKAKSTEEPVASKSLVSRISELHKQKDQAATGEALMGTMAKNAARTLLEQALTKAKHAPTLSSIPIPQIPRRVVVRGAGAARPAGSSKMSASEQIWPKNVIQIKEDEEESVPCGKPNSETVIESGSSDEDEANSPTSLKVVKLAKRKLVMSPDNVSVITASQAPEKRPKFLTQSGVGQNPDKRSLLVPPTGMITVSEPDRTPGPIVITPGQVMTPGPLMFNPSKARPPSPIIIAPEETKNLDSVSMSPEKAIPKVSSSVKTVRIEFEKLGNRAKMTQIHTGPATPNIPTMYTSIPSISGAKKQLSQNELILTKCDRCGEGVAFSNNMTYDAICPSCGNLIRKYSGDLRNTKGSGSGCEHQVSVADGPGTVLTSTDIREVLHDNKHNPITENVLMGVPSHENCPSQSDNVMNKLVQ